MKLNLAFLFLTVPATEGLLWGQVPDPAALGEYVLAENNELKAVVRVRSAANLTDQDWLVLDITDRGPAARIKSATINASTELNNNHRSSTLDLTTLGVPARGRPGASSAGNELPAGKYMTLEPSDLVGTMLGLPDAPESIRMHLMLNVTLTDGRSISAPGTGVSFTFTWLPPSPAQIEVLNEQAVALLLRATADAYPLSTAETNRMHLLLTTPVTSQTVTLDQALGALKQRQLDGTFRFGEVLGLVMRRWPNNPAVIAFYREGLATRGPEALADLSLQVGTPWDDVFIEPVIQLMEKAAAQLPLAGAPPLARYQVVEHGLSLLDRHYASWSSDASIPPRLSKTLLQVVPLGAAGFYDTLTELERTHDRGMIAFLRPFLGDKTIDVFTSVSSNMPYGRTPLRLCDLAANGILNLLGEPEMIDPQRRAAAPIGGPYPEWDDWDKKIAALQQRLDRLPNR